MSQLSAGTILSGFRTSPDLLRRQGLHPTVDSTTGLSLCQEIKMQVDARDLRQHQTDVDDHRWLNIAVRVPIQIFTNLSSPPLIPTLPTHLPLLSHHVFFVKSTASFAMAIPLLSILCFHAFNRLSQASFFSHHTNATTLIQQKRQGTVLVTKYFTLFSTGDPSSIGTANTGFDCRVDLIHDLWGFCPTSVISATDCGLAGSCVDKHGCSRGCGFTNAALTTFTWFVLPALLLPYTELTISLM